MAAKGGLGRDRDSDMLIMEISQISDRVNVISRSTRRDSILATRRLNSNTTSQISEILEK